MIKLNNFYSKEGIFYDKNNDELYDGIKGKIHIRENASIAEKLTALNMLARLSYECTAMSIDNIEYFTSNKNIPENSIVILIDKQANLNDDETQLCIVNSSLQVISTSENVLKENGKYIYGRMPYIWNIGKEERTLNDIVNIFESIGFSEANIEKITITSKYEGLKNIHINAKSSKLSRSSLEEVLKELEEFDMVKTITVNIDGKELIVENKNFQEIMHSTEQSEDLEEVNNKPIELSDLFSINGIYTDSEDDLMNNRMDVKIAVDENISDKLVKAVGNIVVRTALDCLELKLDLVKIKVEAGQKNIIEIVENNNPNAKMYLDESKNKIVIEGNEDSILHLSENIAKQYPFIDGDKTVQIKDLKVLFDNILNGKNYQGQVAYLENALVNEKESKEFKLYANMPGQKNVDILRNIIESNYDDKNIEILDYKKEEMVWKETFEPEWEVDTFENIMKSEVYPMLKSDDEVTIQGCLSEEKSVRDELTDRINAEINKKGSVLKSSNIFSSYKQGFSWITEKVIPELKELQKPDKIIIKFKPFMPEGMTDWLDENGVMPTYASTISDNKDKWYDLPIRFLQELYPVDDIIANELEICRENIIFKDDDSLTDTYEITCYAGEKEIYKDTGITRVSERPYLDEVPELGKVHPTTGWITVCVNGQIVVDKQIKTDLENIWDFYQSTVLSKAKEYISEKGNGKVLIENQPFFKELKIEAEISDLDYKLSTRKDLLSSLDAFHEDIYFVGSDFFKYLGIKMAGKPASEPGLILPVLKKRNGKGPKVTASLKKSLYDVPKLFVDGKDFILQSVNVSGVKVSSLEYNNDNIEVNVKVDSDGFKLLSKYATLINEKAIVDITSDSIITVCFEDETTGQKSIINKNECFVKKEKKQLENSKINTDNLIGYDDYLELMNELKDVKQIKSYVASQSYQGRDVYTIEMFDEDLNDIVSRAKLINYKPVCFINSRHHANEVSSTNAAFNLIKCLANDESYKHYLEKLNIVIIPFENPDGGYIHYELQKDNPEWKTHVARFDSLGKDIGAEWFKFDTIHTEALAYTKTWFKWLPDLVTDNHGVPSHEWDQQFSGYVSPSFKGFWLPRSLYYGLFWYITDEEYTKNNVGICKIIQDKLSDLINADEEITKWNIEWANRHQKYAHAWLPKLFPADYYKNMVYYWVPFNTKKNPKYASHFYPNITGVDWCTEVSDETATGEYLGTCARAHLNACKAAMDSVISLNNKAEVLDHEKNGQIILNKKRKRPLYM